MTQQKDKRRENAIPIFPGILESLCLKLKHLSSPRSPYFTEDKVKT